MLIKVKEGNKEECSRDHFTYQDQRLYVNKCQSWQISNLRPKHTSSSEQIGACLIISSFKLLNLVSLPWPYMCVFQYACVMCCTQLFPCLTNNYPVCLSQQQCFLKSAALSHGNTLAQTQTHKHTQFKEQMSVAVRVCVWMIRVCSCVSLPRLQVCWPLSTALMSSGEPESRTSSPTPKLLLSSPSSSPAWWRSDKVLKHISNSHTLFLFLVFLFLLLLSSFTLSLSHQHSACPPLLNP